VGGLYGNNIFLRLCREMISPQQNYFISLRRDEEKSIRGFKSAEINSLRRNPLVDCALVPSIIENKPTAIFKNGRAIFLFSARYCSYAE
jgi:hypothetical protein